MSNGLPYRVNIQGLPCRVNIWVKRVLLIVFPAHNNINLDRNTNTYYVGIILNKLGMVYMDNNV